MKDSINKYTGCFLMMYFHHLIRYFDRRHFLYQIIQCPFEVLERFDIGIS